MLRSKHALDIIGSVHFTDITLMSKYIIRTFNCIENAEN